MRYGYPIFLDVVDRQVVIVGGGAVASRKAAGVLAAGATRVRAVAPQFVKNFPAEVERIERAFEAGHLDKAGLVFAATDSSQVNDAVVAAAHERGIWVSRADGDDDEPGDFITPALARLGEITVAVSAAGAPALAAVIRDELAGGVSEQWIKLAHAMNEIRPAVLGLKLPVAKRREILRTMASADAAGVLAEGGIHKLWAWARARFNELPENLPTGGKRI